MKDLISKYCSPEWVSLTEHHQKKCTVLAKETIFAEGQDVEGVYLIDRGFVKVISTFGDNKERILRLSKDGMILGHRAFLTKQYKVAAIALTDCEIRFIPMKLFIQLMKGNPEFSMYMFEFVTLDLNDSEEHHRILTIQDVRQRMAYIICKLINTFGYDRKEKNKLAYTISRKDFSTMANTTYETVIRTLSYLEKKKYIHLVGKEIAISNENLLRELAFQKEK